MIDQEVNIKGKKYEYINVKLGTKAPMVVLKGETGYIMCGYLNIDAANAMGDIAVRVTGVNDINDVLNSKVNSCSQRALELGIKPGDNIMDVIDKL
ncbi:MULTISPECIES: YunC family protein [Acidiplasma]|jgi:uncharacterized protein YunC (DUF1805 family)|uniref:DUF1805 domain-containing protein n=4 Tax=Acidiplasma TaxID=507753 RepID=A0A0N8VLE9_9ARCH|nr:MULTISPECIES: DUF1805 domain-containing protein [Acidiplasma]KJE48694.1 hypothetical protein TZ01_08685 [Acidiplasma sp. MBA-1]KPV47551.1 hypothetical protein SE19_00570 [Acidiplasma aeolicum]KQB36332.1 hypothetical protein AOG55_04365 [Acidiplasma cupricumulans]WMT55467.1 MAG: DUF1805 domain-containing protein [Acidiplasma sp.]